MKVDLTKIEWMKNLNSLELKRNEVFGETALRMPLIDLNFDKLKNLETMFAEVDHIVPSRTMCDHVKHFSEQFGQISISLKTFSQTLPNYDDDLLTPNESLFGAQRSLTRFEKLFHKIPNDYLPDLTEKTRINLSKRIEVAFNLTKIEIKSITEGMTVLSKNLVDLQKHIKTIKASLIEWIKSKDKSKHERLVKVIRDNLIAATKMFYDTKWLTKVRANVETIQKNIETLTDILENVGDDLIDLMPLPHDEYPEIQIVTKARRERLELHSSEMIGGVDSFLETIVPVARLWMQPLKDILNENSLVFGTFETEIAECSTKIMFYLEIMLLSSHITKHELDIIPEMENYLNNFLKIRSALSMTGMPHNFDYAAQLLKPWKDRLHLMSKSSATQLGQEINAFHIELKKANENISKSVSSLKGYITEETKRSKRITDKILELHKLLKEEEEKVDKKKVRPAIVEIRKELKEGTKMFGDKMMKEHIGDYMKTISNNIKIRNSILNQLPIVIWKALPHPK